MDHLRHQNYKDQHTKREYLHNKILKVKSSLLQLEKKFKELKERELKDRERKVRKGIGELFFKPINTSIEDMDKFEEKEMMKKTHVGY